MKKYKALYKGMYDDLKDSEMMIFVSEKKVTKLSRMK